VWCTICFDSLNRLGVDHQCNGQTDRIAINSVCLTTSAKHAGPSASEAPTIKATENIVFPNLYDMLKVICDSANTSTTTANVQDLYHSSVLRKSYMRTTPWPLNGDWSGLLYVHYSTMQYWHWRDDVLLSNHRRRTWWFNFKQLLYGTETASYIGSTCTRRTRTRTEWLGVFRLSSAVPVGETPPKMPVCCSTSKRLLETHIAWRRSASAFSDYCGAI